MVLSKMRWVVFDTQHPEQKKGKGSISITSRQEGVME